MPDVALVEVDFPGLGKVEVFGPGVTIVDDEFYFAPDPIATPLVLSLSPDWIKLVFKDPIIIGLTEKLESQNIIALWERCKKLGSPDVGHPSV